MTRVRRVGDKLGLREGDKWCLSRFFCPAEEANHLQLFTMRVHSIAAAAAVALVPRAAAIDPKGMLSANKYSDAMPNPSGVRHPLSSQGRR